MKMTKSFSENYQQTIHFGKSGPSREREAGRAKSPVVAAKLPTTCFLSLSLFVCASDHFCLRLAQFQRMIFIGIKRHHHHHHVCPLFIPAANHSHSMSSLFALVSDKQPGFDCDDLFPISSLCRTEPGESTFLCGVCFGHGIECTANGVKLTDLRTRERDTEREKIPRRYVNRVRLRQLQARTGFIFLALFSPKHSTNHYCNELARPTVP